MANRDFYERLYELEWSRRNDLHTTATIPAGVLTLLGGALAVMATKFVGQSADIRVAFWFFFSCAAVGFLASAGFLIRATYGYMYRRIPLPADLRLAEERLEEYHLANEGTLESAATDFDAELTRAYVEAADKNARNNVVRAEYLHHGITALVAGLFGLALATVPYAAAERARSAENITLTSLQERPITMSDTYERAEQKPEKPVFPPNIDLRGSVEDPSTLAEPEKLNEEPDLVSNS